MYWVYVALLIGVEIYRYELEDREETMRRHSDMLLQALEALNNDQIKDGMMMKARIILSADKKDFTKNYFPSQYR